ncbi:MAG: hypothetical protein SFW07_00930 [Gammaproteobacteria bacterium]|nr:hypothetical protein [Gammaproteobacteria bacterium]
MAAENPLFTPDAKSNFLACFDELPEKKKKKLPQILSEAALGQHKFPASISDDIEGFQQSLKQHSNNKKIQSLQKECIEEYFNTEGTEKFLEATQSADIRWSSPLLKFLSDQLKLEIEEEPIIEAKIKKNGKVAWHSINPITGKPIDGGLKSKRCSAFKYNKAKCWRMTVDDFRKFKNSGKRWGNQAITQERFVAYFAQNHNALHAEEVWNELKKLGILNENDRLSANWRALSNVSINLEALSDPQNIISIHDIHEYIEDTCGGSNKRLQKRDILDEDDFVAQWSDELQDEMRAIWQIIQDEMLDDGRPNYKRKSGCYEKIAQRQLTYSKICNALYHLANTPGANPNFRPERTFNKWTDKGVVQNDLQTAGQQDEELDIGIFAELKTHEVSNDQTEHDHVTSAAILDDYKAKKIKEIKKEIKDAKNSISLLNDQLELMEDEENIEEIQNEIDNQKYILAAAQEKLDRITNETEQNWWTIELPEERHHRGLTYQVPSKKQIKKIKNPLLDEANHYLNEAQSSETYLAEIGAFRNLYRSQTREHQPIKSHSPIGHLPFLFFQDRPELSAKISKMFNQRIQDHADESDGLKKPKAVRKLF